MNGMISSVSSWNGNSRLNCYECTKKVPQIPFQIRVLRDTIVMREIRNENGRAVFGKEANVWKRCGD